MPLYKINFKAFEFVTADNINDAIAKLYDDDSNQMFIGETYIEELLPINDTQSSSARTDGEEMREIKTDDILDLLQDKINENKLILMAVDEIKNLRDSLEFQIKLAQDYNRQRLSMMDNINKCAKLYEKTCQDIRETTHSDYVCEMCKYNADCDHGSIKLFDESNCFELDYNKFLNIIYDKDDKKG